MELKLLYGSFFFLFGWIWFYLFIRQFLCNFLVAFPLIKKIKSVQADLIVSNAVKYTWVSVFACTAVSAVLVVIIVFLFKLYMQLCVLGGLLVGFIMFISRLKPTNPEMFDAFCASYYRFIPDDELRTATYNKDTHRMKLRLNAMQLSYDFIPRYQEKGK